MAEISQKLPGTGKKRRGPGRPFVKGQVANPGGRPKVVAEIRDLARVHCPEAIATLVRLMLEGKEPTQVAAAKELLDRGYGRAPMELTGKDGAPLLGDGSVLQLAEALPLATRILRDAQLHRD